MGSFPEVSPTDVAVHVCKDIVEHDNVDILKGGSGFQQRNGHTESVQTDVRLGGFERCPPEGEDLVGLQLGKTSDTTGPRWVRRI